MHRIEMRFDNTTNEVDTIETLIIFLPANQNHHFMQRYEQLGEVELLKERWLSACCHVHFQPLCLLLLLASLEIYPQPANMLTAAE